MIVLMCFLGDEGRKKGGEKPIRTEKIQASLKNPTVAFLAVPLVSSKYVALFFPLLDRWLIRGRGGGEERLT